MKNENEITFFSLFLLYKITFREQKIRNCPDIIRSDDIFLRAEINNWRSSIEARLDCFERLKFRLLFTVAARNGSRRGRGERGRAIFIDGEVERKKTKKDRRKFVVCSLPRVSHRRMKCSRLPPSSPSLVFVPRRRVSSSSHRLQRSTTMQDATDSLVYFYARCVRTSLDNPNRSTNFVQGNKRKSNFIKNFIKAKN